MPTISYARHRFAIRWLEAGGDIYDLSRHLGHSSVTTTERLYLPFVDMDKRRAAQAAAAAKTTAAGTKPAQPGRTRHRKAPKTDREKKAKNQGMIGVYLAEGAVISEPFSEGNSLITRENTGNIRDSGRFGLKCGLLIGSNHWYFSEIPYAAEQGIFLREQGIISTEQGIF